MDSFFNKSAIKSISAAVDDECKFKRFIDQCRYEAGKTAGRLGDFFVLFCWFQLGVRYLSALFSSIFFKDVVTALLSCLDVLQKMQWYPEFGSIPCIAILI